MNQEYAFLAVLILQKMAENVKNVLKGIIKMWRIDVLILFSKDYVLVVEIENYLLKSTVKHAKRNVTIIVK